MQRRASVGNALRIIDLALFVRLMDSSVTTEHVGRFGRTGQYDEKKEIKWNGNHDGT